MSYDGVDPKDLGTPMTASPSAAPDLGPLRREGDVVADQYVNTHFNLSAASGKQSPLAEVASALRRLEDPPEWIRQWVDDAQSPPPWADPGLIRAGQRFFNNWDLDIVTALFCASLPFAYAAADGVEVLLFASTLSEPSAVARRIAETGRFILAISTPDALDPGKLGSATISQVRLLHAAIRAELGEGWDAATLGVPVNQADLLGTLLSFTTIVLAALERLGVTPSEEERSAYLHLWAVVGYLLGVEGARCLLEPGIPEELTRQVAAQFHRSSPAGHHLARILLAEMEMSMPLGARQFPRALIRYLVGDDVANAIGVPPAPWWSWALALGADSTRPLAGTWAGGMVRRAPSRLVGRSVIRAWIDLHSGTGPHPWVQLAEDRLRDWNVLGSGRVFEIRRRLRKRRRHLRQRRAEVRR